MNELAGKLSVKKKQKLEKIFFYSAHFVTVCQMIYLGTYMYVI